MLVKVAEPCVGKEEIEAVAQVLMSGRYVQGPKVKEFEEKFADYIGTKYAVACNSGTAALHLSLMALDIKEGDEVIVPPLTFFATIEAVLYQRATPVFADVDDIYCLDPEDVANKVTKKTKAVLPVHFYGYVADMDNMNRIACENKLYVIEDAAQAHGAEYKGRKAGSLGDAGCWSFYATKNMTTGEGGMITTDNEEIMEKTRIIRSHGMTDRNTHSVLGYNYRMNEMSAAIGLIQLSKLNEMNDKRTENSLFLLNHLKNVSWLRLPKLKPHIKHAWFWFPCWVDEEKLGLSTDRLVDRLRNKGVEVRFRYNQPLYKQPVLGSRYRDVYLPNAEKIAGRMIGLPNHPNLSEKELRTIISIIKED